MCQMRVMLEREPEPEQVMESVTRLDVLNDGIRLSTMFEEPRIIPGVRIKTIDFLSGTLILVASEDAPPSQS